MKINSKFIISVVGSLIFLVALNVFLLWPRSYKTTYTVDGLEIVEEFNKKNGYYHFQTTSDGVDFMDVVVSKKIEGKKLIKNVNTFSSDEMKCLKFESEKLVTTPICYDGDDFVDASLAGNEVQNVFERESVSADSKEYKNIKIDATLGKKFLIWGQKGYFYITADENKDLMFLEKESYYNNLPYQVNEYVLAPDYDSNYTFNKFYMINMKNGKLNEWQTEEELNFNSYYLGTHDNLAYLFDRKDKKEYKIDPKKKRIEVISKSDEANVWAGKWETISTTKLVNNDYVFEKEEIFTYEIEDQGLYRKINDERLKVSLREVGSIVKIYGNEVFYLVGDTLYSYSPKYGEVAMIKYSEWNFNNKNAIFIY